MCKYANGNTLFHGSRVHLVVECIAATETNDATFRINVWEKTEQSLPWRKALVPIIFVVNNDKIIAKGVTIDIRSAIACVRSYSSWTRRDVSYDSCKAGWRAGCANIPFVEDNYRYYSSASKGFQPCCIK